MYEAYWKLERKPFETCSDSRFYYPSEVHQGALLKLRYAVENRRGGALLAGASGTGKTLVVQMLRRQLSETFSPFVHLVFPQMSAEDLLAYLADELGAPGADLDDTAPSASVRRIEHFLAGNAGKGRHAVVVVDEAHLLEGTRVLEMIRLLLNFEVASEPALTLVLVGQPALLPTLERMPQLEERLGVKSLLRPFTLEESVSYVNHRLTAAGAKRTIFEPEALEALHHLTHGAARRINRLGDLALLVAFAEEQKTITAAQIESVSEELVTVAPD
jgi:type II secretory pathway predicted ATPase ExeA